MITAGGKELRVCYRCDFRAAEVELHLHDIVLQLCATCAREFRDDGVDFELDDEEGGEE